MSASNINLDKILLISLSLLFSGLYFATTESFLIISTTETIIKKWYLAILFIIIYYKLNRINQIKFLKIQKILFSLLAVALLIYFISSHHEIELKIKLILLYYLPIFICIIMLNSSRKISLYIFYVIILTSILYIFLFYLFLFIDVPAGLTVDDRYFSFANYTYWRDPLSEAQIKRYSFPGMEQGMFMARLYIILFSILFISLNYSIFLQVFYLIIWIIMILAASRSSFIGLLAGLSISLFVSKNRIKLFILILVPILFSIYPLAEYYKRQVTFLYGFEPTQRFTKLLFGYDLEKKFPALIDTKEDYHLRNSSFSTKLFIWNNYKNKNLDSNKLSEYNKEDISDKPLGLHAVIFKDVGFLSGCIILIIYILIFFSTLKNIKFLNYYTNIFIFLFVVVVPSIFIKVLLNQGENEYYIWITVGLLANLATSNES
jgi:hypothetical protein